MNKNRKNIPDECKMNRAQIFARGNGVYEEVEEIFRDIDLDKNGTIEYNGTSSFFTLRILNIIKKEIGGKFASNLDVKRGKFANGICIL